MLHLLLHFPSSTSAITSGRGDACNNIEDEAGDMRYDMMKVERRDDDDDDDDNDENMALISY